MYMEDFEQKALNGLECPPRVFWRYVDSTFVVIKWDKVNEFFQHLNTLDPHIKFSMELESTSGTLAFLDCMTHKSGGKLKPTVYRKSTDSSAVLNYSSAHPQAVYASIASAMFRRVRALCTEEVDRRAAQVEVKKRLQANGYPVGLIKRQLRRVVVPTPRRNKELIGTAVIPYKAGTSEVIRRVLNTANIRDRLPVDRTRNCVYKIKCHDCTKVYISQTARELHTRIGEHKRSINRPPRNAEEYQAHSVTIAAESSFNLLGCAVWLLVYSPSLTVGLQTFHHQSRLERQPCTDDVTSIGDETSAIQLPRVSGFSGRYSGKKSGQIKPSLSFTWSFLLISVYQKILRKKRHQPNRLKARWLSGKSANLLTGMSVVRTRPLPLDFSSLGLGNLVVSQPSCFPLVPWQIGTERVLQLNCYNDH
ncbi:hypothetical protein T265_04157 [Opisthorchis viverrini]|uniref:C2H2-type domain-containing protein n=1 Tax=Opisthorchis viverrini TaxID=6198 RepID=A0A074ZTM2_OPIVI|nr:hypothetical protein T265_04157 [Opisthorchis viverrini]KER29147.1 hypothetical protein T265_04157 [Opisthorchis viverrini]